LKHAYVHKMVELYTYVYMAHLFTNSWQPSSLKHYKNIGNKCKYFNTPLPFWKTWLASPIQFEKALD